jgi:hypothetical protein
MDSLVDLTDVINHIFKKDILKDSAVRKPNHIQIGVFPAIGYTLQTGFAVVVSTNAVIYKKHRKAKDSLSSPSTINTSISYSQKNQIILPFQAVLYFNNNNTILVSDWRYLKYPSYTYGLGMNTSPQDSTLLSYQYFKFHQSILFQVHPRVFVGIGYSMDYFWNIRQVYDKPGMESDFQQYGSGRLHFHQGFRSAF